MFYAYSYILPKQQKIRVKEENIKKNGYKKAYINFVSKIRVLFLVKKIQ